MTQMIIVAAAAVGLIVFVTFVASRLVRTRTAGMSIRMQIFLALALIVGSFAFGLGLMVLDRIKARADLVGLEAAQGEARTVAALVSAEMESTGSSLGQMARRLERYTATSKDDLHVSLLGPDSGELFTRGRSYQEQNTVTALADVTVNGKRVGQVRVVKPTLEIRKTLADFAPTVLVISLLLGGVAAGAAMIIGRTIAEPIETLTGFAERVSQGDRRAPPPQGHGREVIRLSRSLDSMRRELQGRPFVETFAADLSHELKNPVAAIRASAEVLRDGALDEPAQGERFVARILESTSRIEALLSDLLSLAKLEARGVEDAAVVDMGARAEAALRAAREQGADIEIDLGSNLSVRGDGAWLTRAVENLIENARLHGDEQPIELKVWRDDDEVACTVINGGRVSKGVERRIFRRFVTTRADRGGTGLGLAIVRAIAEAHGGRARCLELGPPKVSFEVRLPAA